MHGSPSAGLHAADAIQTPFGADNASPARERNGVEDAHADRLSSHAAAGTSRQGARSPYIISRAVPSDAELSQLLLERLRQTADAETRVLEGLNVSADSFYSSQVRRAPQLLWCRHSAHILACCSKQAPASLRLPCSSCGCCVCKQ